MGQTLGLLRDIYEELEFRMALTRIGEFQKFERYWDEAKLALMRKKMFLSHPMGLAINWQSLADYLSRAWVSVSLHSRSDIQSLTRFQFERIWVVQELANAKNAWFQIGYGLINWEPMEDGIAGLRYWGVTVLYPISWVLKEPSN